MQKKTTDELNRLTVEGYKTTPKVPLIVVLDNVRSQHNIGATFRTADAFAIEGIYLCGICCCPPNNEIHKTALGAEETVTWRYFEQTTDAVTALQEQGYRVYAVEQVEGSIDLENIAELIPQGTKVAVVLGHEVFGVDQAVVDACDEAIEIRQYGTKHSLNVSVTAGIIIHRIANLLR